MDPITLAGLLATAYSLGLIPEGKGPHALAGLLGYGMGHHGKGDMEAANSQLQRELRAQELRHRDDMHAAHKRELELLQAVARSAEAQRTQQALHETLQRAAAAHRA